MTLSVNPHRLARYRDVAELLIKYRPASDGETQTTDAEALAGRLEEMGPTFVKLGQLLSTRTDLLPSAYTRALSRLQDNVDPLPFDTIETVVRQELGTNLARAFSMFESTPIASASLGQVHRAALRDGRPVAVKVQRPGVRQQVLDDLALIEDLAGFADNHTKTGRSYGFSGMVEEFRRSVLPELNYRSEAANLRTLGENLAGLPRIVVPQPISDYTTELVLTMSYVDGRNVGSLGPLAMLELDGVGLSRELFTAYLDQILVHGFVHVDPHPGNVMVTSDGRLALVDLGMVARVRPELRKSLVRLLLAVADSDGQRIAAVMGDLGDKRPDWDPERFERRIVHLVSEEGGRTVGQLEAGRIVGELARIGGDCGLRPAEELTMVSKALFNLDQVAAKLDPDFDPNEVINQHVGEILRHQMLQSGSPSNILAVAMDAKEFAEKLPGRVNKLMDALAEGQLTLNVQGIDERELMRGIQKLANRVTTGLIIAALIVGAAMLMRIDTKSKLFGYPSLAIVCFLAAAAAGIWLIVGSILHDLPQRRRRR